MTIKKCLWIGMLLIFSFVFYGCQKQEGNDKKDVQQVTDCKELMQQWNVKLSSKEVTCWYTNEPDKEWLEAQAKLFEKEYGIHVSLVFYDGMSFFEDLNKANQKGEGPDLYLLGNDQLQLAVQGGMANENLYFNEEFFSNQYPEIAKKAVTYQDKQYGYPIYFDTYCLVYDANLLENAPASIDDILAFLDAYEDTGSTKAVFRWDVADPYINSMFFASYANLFGENGDEPESFSVNNEKCVSAMEYYQSLSAYLWMNKSNISHEIIANRIKDGTLVLGLCKTDILPILLQSQNTTDSQGENVTNYQVSYVPSLTSELSSTAFSTTYSAFVNPYANNETAADMFGLYLSYVQSGQQYDGNGKLPVVNQKDKFDETKQIIYAQYLNSKPVPKVAVLGDYLAESGIVFDKIWSGENAKEQLDALQSIMQEKISE